ncbi:MAG: ion transporter [Bacteroidales bacterium]|nr:ion transporter [Bacteroidales bacterium]
MTQDSPKNKIQKFKTELNRVFDDNLHTEQWHNYVDYAIIGLIIVSTIEVFLSTYDGIVEKYGTWLHIVDYFTTIFFTIEVSLRIWCADLLDEKYKGFWGRVRYCFSFYGLIDILSTFPFYLQFLMSVPYAALKALRIARLLRIFRYMKSFDVLSRAMAAKKDEMSVSLQFLVIVTLILSFVLFFVEHDAQPDVYDNGWKSVVWAFAQYIGDPGNFADTPPITFIGRVIACIIGILGIAIFAVPAGLIGSAFSEVMEKDAIATKNKENVARIHKMMLVRNRKRVGIYFPAKNISFGDLKMNLGLSEDEILKAVMSSQKLRVKNLALAQGDDKANDMLVVNQFYANTDYGSHVERESSVTIVNPCGSGDNGLSYFAWHIAQLGGFNYVANEYFSRWNPDSNYRQNFYTVSEETKNNPVFDAFISDIVEGKNATDWIVLIAGEQIVKNITDIHFEFGGEKGCDSFDFPECITNDKEKLKLLFEDFKTTLENKLNLQVDAHQVQPKLNVANVSRYIHTKTNANVLLITVSYKLMVFDKSVYSAIYTIADILMRNLESRKKRELHTKEYSLPPSESSYWETLYSEDANV